VPRRESTTSLTAPLRTSPRRSVLENGKNALAENIAKMAMVFAGER
jgi:hypothetical protein